MEFAKSFVHFQQIYASTSILSTLSEHTFIITATMTSSV